MSICVEKVGRGWPLPLLISSSSILYGMGRWDTCSDLLSISLLPDPIEAIGQPISKGPLHIVGTPWLSY